MWGGLAAIAGIVVIVAALVWNARIAATAAGERGATNIVELINADIKRNIELHDAPIRAVVNLEQTQAFANLPPEALHAIKFGQLSTSRTLGAMLVLDAQGNVIADSRSLVPRPDNFIDRDYFQQHLKNASPDLRVGYLMAPRFDDRQPRLVLSRRVSDAQGRFQGVVVSGMQLSYFRQLLEGLEIDAQSTVNLLHADGTLLARRRIGNEQDRTGQNFGKLPNFAQALRERSGSLRSRSVLDGLEREYVFSGVGDYPLMVVVGLSLPEVYQAWTRATIVICTATAALCLAILAWLFRINRELMERRYKLARANELARTDGLTRLPNRMHFEERLLREKAQAVSPDTVLSMLLIDVDHFKRINDRFGHPAGDRALTALAGVIGEAAYGRGWFAARYGGEEFVVLLPSTPANAALRVAEKICHDVKNLALDMGAEARLTVSIGLASCSDPLASREALVARADTALYQAKNTGRDRVCRAD